MSEVDYLRAQASLCLEIARQMSDGKAAQKLRSDAARYRAQAAEIEQMEQSTPMPGEPSLKGA